MKNKISVFLRKRKIIALLCFMLLLIVILVFIRAQLFLSNRCPSCWEFLYFYEPYDYYTPLFEKALTIKKGMIAFSFSIDKYGSYYIGLKKMNKNEDTFHLSKDIDYKLSCESIISSEYGRKSFGYKKIFFHESVLLDINRFNDQEKEKSRRSLLASETRLLEVIAAFDIGDWSAGKFYDDIGRQYDCTVEFFMDEADFFEADLVVRRRPPH